MARPYSYDLRQKAVEAVLNGAKLVEVSELQSFPLLWGTVATFGKPICKRRRINQ